MSSSSSSPPEPEYRKHKITLAVKATPNVLLCRKEYGGDYDRKLLPDRAIKDSYEFHLIPVPISIGKADEMMYKEVFKALKLAKSPDPSYGDKILTIVFNGPLENWVAPPPKGSSNGARVHVEAEPFLKRLYEVCGPHLDILIEGDLWNMYFNHGRKKRAPIGKDGPIALRVNSGGKTAEVNIPMPSEYFEKNYVPIESELTVSLSWFGPEPLFDYLPHCEALRKKSKPDLKISVAEGKKTYKCHSDLLKQHSPVFSAMLSNDMTELQKKEIMIVDFDYEIVEAFLRYIYAGNIVKPYKDCHFCFELLYFAHKYDISELEGVTIELFRNKPEHWLSTATALELYHFAPKLIDGKGLKKRAKSNLASRRQELMDDFPEFLEQLQLD